jgi:site-specific recombinase XerD
VLDSESNAVSFTLIDATGVVDPAVRYLAETERSPNTIKAHAHDLKDCFVFLDEYGRDWQSVKLEDVGASCPRPGTHAATERQQPLWEN